MLTLSLDRGWVDSLGEERRTFDLREFLASSMPWRCYLVDGSGRVAVDENGLVSCAEVPKGSWLLGRTRDGVTHFVFCGVGAAEANGPGTPSFVALTDIGERLSDDEALLATQASALSQWHSSDRFCAGCGGEVKAIEMGWATQCQRCRRIEYPRTDAAVIVQICDEEDRVLLVHNVAWAKHRVSLPAGFVEAGETPRRAVIREIQEEVGLSVCDPTYLGSQPWPRPRSLMLGFRARLAGPALPRPDQVEIDWAAFYHRDEYRQAVREGKIVPPRPTSIAQAMLSAWLDGDGNKNPDLSARSGTL